MTNLYYYSLAIASDDGKLHVLDIHRQLILFSHNISGKCLGQDTRSFCLTKLVL
jgi:hypothetical protein